MTSLVVAETGPQSTFQDLGRDGHADLGIGGGGAADRAAARRANRLVGNPEGAVVVESLLGGLCVESEGDVVLVVTGAPAEVTVDGRPFGPWVPVVVPSGSVLCIGTPVAGLRTYLAVGGGFDAPRLLGSASTSLTATLGPPPLQAGDRLAVHDAGRGLPMSEPTIVTRGWGEPFTARVVVGPRADWFTKQAVETLFASTWSATSELDRVGVRLDGPVLERARDGELLSEGTVLGGIQVPPHGRPLVLLADRPLTGGYPVIGCVVDEDIDRFGQMRPGDEVRFLRVPPPFVVPG